MVLPPLSHPDVTASEYSYGLRCCCHSFFAINIHTCFQKKEYLFCMTCLWGKYKGTIQNQALQALPETLLPPGHHTDAAPFLHTHMCILYHIYGKFIHFVSNHWKTEKVNQPHHSKDSPAIKYFSFSANIPHLTTFRPIITMERASLPAPSILLLCSCLFQLFYKNRQYLKQIAHDAIVGHIKNGGPGILVNRHNHI